MSITYFVDNINGYDGNVGYDMDSTLKTIAKAMTLCIAGDIIFILSTGATTVVNESVIIAKDDISIRGENARVELSPPAIGSPSILITGDGANLKTLTIRGTGGGTDNGITISGANDSTIENVRIEDATGYGIDIESGSLNTHILDDVTFDNSTLGDIQDNGTDTYRKPQTAITTGDIADAVWDEPLANHTTADTFGERVGSKLLSLAVWLGLH